MVAKRGSWQGRLLSFWYRKLDDCSERALEEEQLELVWSRCVKSVRFVLNGLIGVPWIFTRESSGRQSRVLLDCARTT